MTHQKQFGPLSVIVISYGCLDFSKFHFILPA